MASKLTLFKSNRLRAVRLPKDIASPGSVKQVVIWQQGKQRIVTPVGAVWDDFFDGLGIDLGERSQPEADVREQF